MRLTCSPIISAAKCLSLLAVAVLVLVVELTLNGAEAGSSLSCFTNGQDHFTITLPAGWQRMPHELAVAFVNPANQKRADDFGAYGYELTTNGNSLTYPMVIVQALRRGRIADHYIKMLENPELRRRATLDLLKKQGIEAQNVFDITFETNRHLLCFSVARTDTDGEKIRSLEGIYFTETGSINVICFGEADNFSHWTEILSKAMHSIEIDRSIQFHPRPANLTGTSFRMKSVLLIPGIMVAAGLFRLLANRFGSRVMSDEI